MKLSSRAVLKIARLYHIADDITPVRALRNLRIDGRDEDSVGPYLHLAHNALDNVL